MPIRRADDNTYTLASGATSTATGENSGNGIAIKGGQYHVFFDGTIGGSTVSLQIKAPSGVWMNVEVFTGNAIAYTTLPRSQSGIDLPAGLVRCALTGGSPTGINCSLVGLG